MAWRPRSAPNCPTTRSRTSSRSRWSAPRPTCWCSIPGIPAKTVAELVALAKTKPGQLNYGSAGPASVAHLAAALFASETGIEMTHVPYKSSAQSSIDMITGRLDMQFATVAPTLAEHPRRQATARSRPPAASASSVLPDVPTMIEAGVKDYDVALWFAYVMPAGTPDAIVARLNREMSAILSDAGDGRGAAQAGLRAGARPAGGGYRAHPERDRDVARAGRQDRHQAGVTRANSRTSIAASLGARQSYRRFDLKCKTWIGRDEACLL